jgi:hypothetical protein
MPAFIVAALVSGKAGVRDLAGRSLRWRVPLRWYLISLLAPLLILLIVVTILYGFAPLRALAENWLLLFTAFLPALAIMILLNNVADEIGWTGFVSARPRSSWSAPRCPADDSILLAVPRSELLCRNAIMATTALVLGIFLLPHLGSRLITGWLYRLQRVDRRPVPFHAQRHRELHRPGGRGRSATVRSVSDHGRDSCAGCGDYRRRHPRPSWTQATRIRCRSEMRPLTLGRSSSRPKEDLGVPAQLQPQEVRQLSKYRFLPALRLMVGKASHQEQAPSSYVEQMLGFVGDLTPRRGSPHRPRSG